jgi:tRNA-dihydrouridine synthase
MKGERRAVFEMRRHLSCYFKGLPDFRETRARLVTETDPAQVLAILDGIAERWGEVPLADETGVYGI